MRRLGNWRLGWAPVEGSQVRLGLKHHVKLSAQRGKRDGDYLSYHAEAQIEVIYQTAIASMHTLSHNAITIPNPKSFLCVPSL